MWGEILTRQEVKFCTKLIERLKPLVWAQPLLGRIGTPESWRYERKPLLFELRFAGELSVAGVNPSYEYTTGVGRSSVDFQFKWAGVEWLIELVTLLTSDAVKRASWDDGLSFGVSLGTDAADGTQSIEGEVLLVQQKIGQKVLSPKRPIKFPEPKPNTYHLIVVDMCGFGADGRDPLIHRQIAYGPSGLPPERRLSWTDGTGIRRPILGLFDAANMYCRASKLLQERIHFIGFCTDETYKVGGIRANTAYLPNPHLFEDDASVRSIFKQYPLR